MNQYNPIPKNFSIKVTPKLSKIGNVDPICPYCKHQLTEFPKSKKKCPSCKNEILVRKRPIDDKQVLLCHDIIPQLEKELLANTAANRIKVYDLERIYPIYLESKNQLKEQFGFNPKENDLIWRVFNEMSNYEAIRGHYIGYGLYLIHMGSLLEAELKHPQAMKFYLQICYLDLTMGCSTVKSPYTLDKSKKENIRPAVFDYILRMKKVFTITHEECKQQYLDVNKVIFEQMESQGLQCKPEETWPIIEQLFIEKEIFQ